MTRVPECLFVQLSTVCGSRCLLCPHCETYGEGRLFPHMEMDDWTWRNLLMSIGGWFKGQLGLYMHYEPLAYPRLFERIAEAKKRVPSCRVAVSTNCRLLGKENRKKLFDSGLDILFLHVPTGNPRRFSEMTRGTLVFETVIRNAQAAVEEAPRGMQVEVVTPRYLGLNERELFALFPADVVRVDCWATSRAGSISGDGMHLLGPPGEKTRFNDKRTDVCFQPDVNMCVFADGDLGFCSNDWRHEAKGWIGNVVGDGIMEPFNGERMDLLRGEFSRGMYGRFRMCDVCSKELNFRRDQ